ncbi:MAG TPA: hypothetical protein VIL46_03050 [Gemmataceae bacterium]
MSLYSDEFRKMVESANRYLAGEEDFMSLYYAIAEAHIAVQRFGPDAAVAPIIREWRNMSDRCRNEFRLAPDPVTEEEFRDWLREQI